MVVDLVRAVAERPEVTLPVPASLRRAVVRAGHDLVTLSRAVLDAPASLVRRIAHPLRLELESCPLLRARDRRVVELADDVARLADVEVEPPVDVVVVHVADAAVLGAGEAEAWPQCAVGVQPPLADVAVPAGLHLAHEDALLPVEVDRHAEVVTRVGAGVHDRLRGRRAEPEAGRDVLTRRLDHPLLPLPVAIRPALVGVVVDVQDRHVGLEEDAPPSVQDVAQLESGAPEAGRRRRADREELPEHRVAARHRHDCLARSPLGRRRLAGIRRHAACRRGRERRLRRATVVAGDPLPRELDPDDLVGPAPPRREQSDRDPALAPTVG